MDKNSTVPALTYVIFYEMMMMSIMSLGVDVGCGADRGRTN